MVKCELVRYNVILCISKLGGLRIHKIVLFHVVFRILEASVIAERGTWLLGDYVFFLICAVVVKMTFLTR